MKSCRSRTATARNSGRHSMRSCRARRCSNEDGEVSGRQSTVPSSCPAKAGHPVRRGLSDQSPALRLLDRPLSRAMTLLVSRPLQRLQVFDQVVPLFVAQHAADDARLAWTRRALERVAENAVAVDRRSVLGRRRKQGFALAAVRLLAGEYAKADLLRIEVARTHAELRGALGRRLEQPIQRGHRAVVKIGSGRPDAVQRARAITRSRRRIGTVTSFAPERRLILLRKLAVCHPFRADLVDHDHQRDRERHVRRGVGRRLATFPVRVEVACGFEIQKAGNVDLTCARTLAWAGSVPIPATLLWTGIKTGSGLSRLVQCFEEGDQKLLSGNCWSNTGSATGPRWHSAQISA